MNIVLDTNVLVSGLLNPNGSPARVLNLVLALDVRLAVDSRILSEYRIVLNRPKFHFNPEYVESLLIFIETESLYFLPKPLSINLQDRADLPFYETAVVSGAQYLVTGNRIHFPDEKWIVTPVEFLKRCGI